MNVLKALPFLLGLALPLLLTSFVSANGDPTPILGDLTVTVEEQENGDIQFTLSGSAPIKNGGYIYETPYEYNSEADSYFPPATRNDYESYSLPKSDMIFSTDGGSVSPGCACDGPEEGEAPSDFPVYEVAFASGGWYLRIFSGGVDSSQTLSGSGSVTVPADYTPDIRAEPEVEEGRDPRSPLAFSDFVPGTYQVQGYYFDITYVVVPYEPMDEEILPISAPAPSISVQGPKPFPSTFVGRSSRTQVVRIRNTGDDTLRGLSTTLVGPASRDFRSSPPRPRNLRPGASASTRVSFRPTRSGVRRAALVVRGNAPSASVPLIGRAASFGLPGPLRPTK